MIISAPDIYKAVLDELNKEHTRSLTPEEFNYFINDTQIVYVKNRYAQYDQHQKRMDDLRVLTVNTDGTGNNPPSILNTGLAQAGQEIILLPYDPLATTPEDMGYLFLLNVAFKISYSGNNCFTDGTISGWMKGKFMRSDAEWEINENPYAKPKDTRLYYKLIGNEIRPITGTSSFVTEANIMYLRYPRKIFFDATGGGNHVDSELPAHCNQELVKLCVRNYLETIRDPRYQSHRAEIQSNFN
jgi:hypothetical protein